jgi:hypothetical protein
VPDKGEQPGDDGECGPDDAKGKKLFLYVNHEKYSKMQLLPI